MLVLERAIKNQWLVTKGLVLGDKVIVEGLLMLRPLGRNRRVVVLRRRRVEQGIDDDFCT
ncbi:MAG: hypothetical protein D3922_10370 [Candidatus Electrothrix sp. AR1]|nr:hypothetical protein [Candidatus Electrothrix sp. AR1]